MVISVIQKVIPFEMHNSTNYIHENEIKTFVAFFYQTLREHCTYFIKSSLNSNLVINPSFQHNLTADIWFKCTTFITNKRIKSLTRGLMVLFLHYFSGGISSFSLQHEKQIGSI